MPGWIKMGRIRKDRLGTAERRLNRKLKHKAKRKGRIDPRTNRPGKRK